MHAKSLVVAYDSFVALAFGAFELTGNVIAIIGHNGAGKSTLIKVALDLIPTRQGCLELSSSVGQNEHSLKPEQHMAFCPEVGAVFSDIAVEDYIKLWCRIKHQDARYYQHSGSRYIELLEIAPLMRKRGRELSKGQRRRVQTAIGFLMQPELFLFDEPFDGLDVQKTSELADIVRAESSQRCFIISSHRMDVVERLADKLIVLKAGKIFAAGEVDAVCVALCGETLTISSEKPLGSLYDYVTQALSKHVINLIGHQISVTGPEIPEALLNPILEEQGLTESRIIRGRPSLVDAMNYHLRGLSHGKS